MPFKIVISLESELSSQELADFFGALAKAEAGNVLPLIKVLNVPDASTIPKPTSFETDSLNGEEQATQTEEPVVVPVVPTGITPNRPPAVPEPSWSRDVVERLTKAHLDVVTLNKIIRRHNFARGLKTHFERKWGFTKASQFARIGQHFNDWSLMDGTISTKEELQEWCKQRGFQGEL